MGITRLTLGNLRQLRRLVERKETLQGEVEAIDAQVNRFLTGPPRRMERPLIGRRPGVRAMGTGMTRRTKSRRKGALKDTIIATLQRAGKGGLHISEISKRTGTKVPNLRVWFYTTGKGVPEIKQTKPATYTWNG